MVDFFRKQNQQIQGNSLQNLDINSFVKILLSTILLIPDWRKMKSFVNTNSKGVLCQPAFSCSKLTIETIEQGVK